MAIIIVQACNGERGHLITPSLKTTCPLPTTFFSIPLFSFPLFFLSFSLHVCYKGKNGSYSLFGYRFCFFPQFFGILQYTLVLHSDSVENKINQSCHSVEILNMYILLITTVFYLPLLSYVWRRRFYGEDKEKMLK